MTKKERQELILSLRAHGLSNRAVGREIGCSEVTVRRDLSEMAGRPRVRRRPEASLALYRAFDADGTLLYVGKTVEARKRTREHLNTSDWGNEFTMMTVDRSFTSMEELEAAEREAIRTERPKYNVVHAA